MHVIKSTFIDLRVGHFCREVIGDKFEILKTSQRSGTISKRGLWWHDWDWWPKQGVQDSNTEQVSLAPGTLGMDTHVTPGPSCRPTPRTLSTLTPRTPWPAWTASKACRAGTGSAPRQSGSRRLEITRPQHQPPASLIQRWISDNEARQSPDLC